MNFTKDQIAELKKKHGEIFELAGIDQFGACKADRA